ncbi:hypothetical protein HDU81_011009 [Chytriomyces hyalinus]|nr:hypothetical protein HDU81_011009 [Chytriomyces hyalinus]
MRLSSTTRSFSTCAASRAKLSSNAVGLKAQTPTSSVFAKSSSKPKGGEGVAWFESMGAAHADLKRAEPWVYVDEMEGKKKDKKEEALAAVTSTATLSFSYFLSSVHRPSQPNDIWSMCCCTSALAATTSIDLLSAFTASGRRLFKESLAQGTAEAFLHLSGNLAHQSEPAFCGLGSLAIVLNALEIDPNRPWKGAWRWYDETLLDCCAPLELIRTKGITFDEFACLAACNGLGVTAKRVTDAKSQLLSNLDAPMPSFPSLQTTSNPTTPIDADHPITREEFIADLKRVCSDPDGSTQMVASFSRKTLHQTGDGHFSPIGCFHEESGQVLVMDVARFKYPSYFVHVDVLYDAMKPIDGVTGKSRGYFLLSKAHEADGAVAIDITNQFVSGLHDHSRATTSSIPIIGKGIGLAARRGGNYKSQIESTLLNASSDLPQSPNRHEGQLTPSSQLSLAKITPLSMSKDGGLSSAFSSKLVDLINREAAVYSPHQPISAASKQSIISSILQELIGANGTPGVLQISFREPAADLAASEKPSSDDICVPQQAQQDPDHHSRILALLSEIESLPVYAYVAKAHEAGRGGRKDLSPLEERYEAALSALLIAALPSSVYLSVHHVELRNFLMAAKYGGTQSPNTSLLRTEVDRMERQLTNLMSK